MKIGGYNMSNWWYIASTKGKNVDLESRQRKESALKTLLQQMDVPAMRMDTSKEANLRWLQRNLAAQNSGHPMFETAITMINQLAREARRKS